MTLVPVIAIWAVYLAGWTILRQSLTRLPRPRWWAVLLWCAVAVPSLVQLLWAPGLLEWGERDSSAVEAGQWWRLVTSIGLQDGGWFGAVFNLSMLAVTLLLVGDVCRGVTCGCVFLVGGVLANVLTIVTVGHSGAGNSMATMCLLVAVVVSLVWRHSRPRLPALLVPLGLVAAAGVTLLVLGDEHGLAVAVGLVTGATLSGLISQPTGEPVE